MAAKEALAKVGIGVGALLFLWFVWPTPYEYTRKYPEVMRVNRFTGVQEVSSEEGWVTRSYLNDKADKKWKELEQEREQKVELNSWDRQIDKMIPEPPRSSQNALKPGATKSLGDSFTVNVGQPSKAITISESPRDGARTLWPLKANAHILIRDHDKDWYQVVLRDGSFGYVRVKDVTKLPLQYEVTRDPDGRLQMPE